MILVVGGAGYIGSHVVKELLDQNKKVVILDNLSTGFQFAVDSRAVFIQGELGDENILRSIFTNYEISAVMHFAANSLVGESVVNPMKYYLNNVSATLTLLSVMIDHQVNSFVFSSTAATYGLVQEALITEKTLVKPINPYGHSKLMIEQILSDLHQANGLNYVTLRYFNAAGAHPDQTIGENHNPETHLIPIVLQHLNGRRENITVYGQDYDTKDGTCIRDYIHVCDLADAHILALDGLLNNTITKEVFNLGNGKGYSVKEIIQASEKVTGNKANVHLGTRREGDPAQLVASSAKIHQALGWMPKYSLDEIIQHAWNYEVKVN
ncbi:MULTISPECIES: UDP-glucose 4-epimerase GalE [Exiguobacterium]|uniref:UDP-glucose 4-epimerase GalE n=1 Tax=Exiguobacterium TaxID=33986 RepID=UPI001BE966EA|nr:MULTISPECIES: UDP-glucose 4-epimerase GalE [Exiguobacterium]MCT4791832.1 UDP-glucose 4-epimerase GalE [Exiguobacterium artemiae]